jgi:hypothetical protein
MPPKSNVCFQETASLISSADMRRIAAIRGGQEEGRLASGRIQIEALRPLCVTTSPNR